MLLSSDISSSLCTGSINMFTLAVRDLQWMMCSFSSLVSIFELPCFIPASPWQCGVEIDEKREKTNWVVLNVHMISVSAVMHAYQKASTWTISRGQLEPTVMPWPHRNPTGEARWYWFTNAVWSHTHTQTHRKWLLPIFHFIPDCFLTQPLLGCAMHLPHWPPPFL